MAGILIVSVILAIVAFLLFFPKAIDALYNKAKDIEK